MDKAEFEKKMAENVLARSMALKDEFYNAYNGFIEETGRKPEVEKFFIGWAMSQINP